MVGSALGPVIYGMECSNRQTVNSAGGGPPPTQTSVGGGGGG